MRHRHEWDGARNTEKGETYVYICMLLLPGKLNLHYIILQDVFAILKIE